ncbi:izumo sperm-egg fusion protein 2 [Eublepharis macularius]|uniref:Izumo sperm-egg fusion protein 2 n=1 Tax=Eublepharis macularius TaxID=481883 RepID=A0AA97K3I1_EUBMA|nr:izumo sperm-egg fusion protein 2 [Eublepharis macularius]
MLLTCPPSLLLLLQLLVLWPTGLQGCLQCDEKFKENVAKLRTELVPRQIHDTRLKVRATALLKGLEGDFFSHYATSQFSGFAVKSTVDALIQEVRSKTEELAQSSLTDQALLDELVGFRKKTTMKLKVALKEHQMKACDRANCAWLRYSVLDCVGCKDINAVCYTTSQCFVDSQDRLSLRYGAVLWDPNIAKNGVAIVLCMGGVLFLVIMGSIIVYWRNQLFLYV